jgi:hypothetical protein
MATTFLGRDALREFLAGPGSLRVVNRTEVGDGVVVLAAAVARHRSGGPPVADTTFSLGLDAEESIELQELPPGSTKPDAIEVVLRLQVGVEQAIVDAYVTASKSAADPDAPFEVGVRRHEGVIGDGENTVPGFAEFAIYALPVG